MVMIRVCAAVAVSAVLAGCGQTGPLYLPGEAPPQKSMPLPVPVPAQKKPAEEPAAENDKDETGS